MGDELAKLRPLFEDLLTGEKINCWNEWIENRPAKPRPADLPAMLELQRPDLTAIEQKAIFRDLNLKRAEVDARTTGRNIPQFPIQHQGRSFLFLSHTSVP